MTIWMFVLFWCALAALVSLLIGRKFRIQQKRLARETRYDAQMLRVVPIAAPTIWDGLDKLLAESGHDAILQTFPEEIRRAFQPEYQPCTREPEHNWVEQKWIGPQIGLTRRTAVAWSCARCSAKTEDAEHVHQQRTRAFNKRQADAKVNLFTEQELRNLNYMSLRRGEGDMVALRRSMGVPHV